MWKGRFKVGDLLPLSLAPTGNTGAPALPDAAPTVRVFNSSGAQVGATRQFAIKDRYGPTALFVDDLLLDSNYAVGHYTVRYAWLVSGSQRVEVEKFEVIPTGDSGGSVIGMAQFTRPEAEYVVYQRDGGTINAGRNPRV